MSSSSSRRMRMRMRIRHAVATGVVALAMFAAAPSPSVMVSANSSGLGIPCDVDNPTLGRMDRMKATIPNNASAIWPMWWTTPQQWANDLRYTLRAGDGPVGTDATQYTPGQYTEIIIRANQVDQQFTGLLMYAVNAANQRVGEWLLPPRQAFQVDPSTGCVTHSNADPKNYKSVFRVKFPAGTGQVTIKALVKFGLAFPEMKGTFYYPNSQQQGHIKLNEAQPQTQTWFQGAIGQSCSQVCESKNMVCDLLSMLQLGSSPSMLNAASKMSTCFGPIMKGCGPYSPTAGSEGCWYQDSSCTRDPVNSQWVQIDPCTTDNVKPYNPNTVYEPNNNNVPCCSFQNQKWCANYYQKGQQPSENNNAWRKAGACVSASSATTQQPVQPPRAAMEMDCESRKNSKEDGQRLCACMIQVTEPPTEPPTESPPPVILPPDEQPTDQPPTDDGTTLPTDSTGTTIRPATTTRPGTTTRPTTTTRPRTTVAPGAGVPLGSGTNAGSRMAPHMIITLLSVLLGAIMSPVSRSSRAIFTIVAALFILGDLPGSSAHNWLTSPSRSNKGGLGDYNGNTSPPCPPKGARVHAQVAAGQRFQMEWASGHGYGSSTYLAVLRASDEQQLKQVTFDVMDDYIKNAPANANVMTDSKAYHIIDGRPKRGDDTSLDRDITAQSPRPAIFRKYNSVFVYSKTAQATAGDRRVSYSSVKYPYLISVHRFAMHEDRPDDMDGVMMEIPPGYPSGQYVIQYQWRGYYDCMDVNVLDVQSTDIWGRAATGGGLDQYHHTMYTPTLPNYKALDGQCIEIKEGQTIEACANLCLNNNEQCDAITVAPGTLDMNIVKFKGLFDVGGQKYATHLPPSCNNVNKANLVCYTVHSGDVPTVGPPFKTVTDPEDFTFYMTTYIKKAAWQFAQACAQCKPSVPPADFRFTDRCISCADMARNYFTQAPPKWQIATTCQHCDNRFG